MVIKILTPADPLWETVRDFADACSWRAGPVLARDMNAGKFTDFERVIAAVDGGAVCGFCTVSKTDCIPDVPYTPYIGFVFVGEAYRGHRLSERMIAAAEDYLRGAGFCEVYLVSDHENLYEKYGFSVIDRRQASWGAMEKIYRKKL